MNEITNKADSFIDGFYVNQAILYKKESIFGNGKYYLDALEVIENKIKEQYDWFESHKGFELMKNKSSELDNALNCGVSILVYYQGNKIIPVNISDKVKGYEVYLEKNKL